MAMSVVYTTFDGEIVHENRGGVASFYAPDTMGSTVALLNSSGVVTDTYSYWPYGETQNHSGSSQTPFGFLGTLGYYLDAAGSFLYVRARYLRQTLARWQTADRLWPHQLPYAYCDNNPLHRIDPSGLLCYAFTKAFGKKNRSHLYVRICLVWCGDGSCVQWPPSPGEDVYARMFIASEDSNYYTGISGAGCAVSCATTCGLDNPWCLLVCGAACGLEANYHLNWCAKNNGDACFVFTEKCLDTNSKCCAGYP